MAGKAQLLSKAAVLIYILLGEAVVNLCLGEQAVTKKGQG